MSKLTADDRGTIIFFVALIAISPFIHAMFGGGSSANIPENSEKAARAFSMDHFPLFGYGAMLLIAFVSAASFGAWRAKQRGLDPKVIWDVAMWVLLSGIAGARIFYLIQHGEGVFRGKETMGEKLFAAVYLPEGGIVLYGGVIGGTVAYFLFCFLRKVRPLVLADIITPSIFIGLGFGRLGCLMNGCCYGDPCPFPWSIEFAPGTVPYMALLERGFITTGAAASLPLHPTQIYSSLNAFLLAFVTASYYPHRIRDGAVLAIACIVYPITRFMLELVRGDELGQFNTNFTISQWVSFLLCACGVAFAVFLAVRSRPLATSPIKS